jgi:hypothetical protein
MTNIPNTLYKYRNWKQPFHNRILTHNEIFLSSANHFNDPFDSSLPFRYEKKLLTKDNIINKLIEVAKFSFPSLTDDELFRMAIDRYNSVDFHSEAYWIDAEENIRIHIKNNFGICSLTSQNDNLLMWSHYANSHTGFCIGLDSEKIFLSVLGILKKMHYSDVFPIIPMFGSGPLDMIELLMTKSTHWQYEEEFRLIRTDSTNKTFNFDNTAIKEIILGCKIDSKDKEEIVSIAKSKNVGIKTYDSLIDQNEFKLNLVEIL